MPKLAVRNFSCIRAADIELADLTILIGPQASGKSVLSKLIYFANDVLSKQYVHLEEEASFKDFIRALEHDFLKLFPATAWGSGKFEIEYTAGPYILTIIGSKRKSAAGRDKIQISISDYFHDRYENFLAAFIERTQKSAKNSKREVPDFQSFWRLRENDEKSLRAELKGSYFPFQLFIPAGRSFFYKHRKGHGGI